MICSSQISTTHLFVVLHAGLAQGTQYIAGLRGLAGALGHVLRKISGGFGQFAFRAHLPEVKHQRKFQMIQDWRERLTYFRTNIRKMLYIYKYSFLLP